MFLATLKQQTTYFLCDFKVYWSKKGDGHILYALLYLLTCHGLHSLALYRFGKVIYSVKVPLLSHLLKIIYRIAWFILSTIYGISINPISEIGPGFYIGHYGGIFVRAKIGSNCSIGQGVTFGSKGAGKSNGWPTVGDNVYVGAGAKIIGAITIGKGSVIGANAVVTKDVPENSLAVGIPARIQLKR
ncbi:MAG: serine acetyltransferase [Blastopirellula sp.]|nr:MAG: serine acetyltransferase [Blastopirellula sp.]